MIIDLKEISTFRAFFGERYNNGQNLIIPYINLGLLPDHTFNKSKELLHLNYCYLIFRNAEVQEINLQLYENSKTKSRIEFLGGINLKTGKFEECMISYEKAWIALTEKSQLQKEYWIPLNHASYKKNLNDHEVSAFLSFKHYNSE